MLRTELILIIMMEIKLIQISSHRKGEKERVCVEEKFDQQKIITWSSRFTSKMKEKPSRRGWSAIVREMRQKSTSKKEVKAAISGDDYHSMIILCVKNRVRFRKFWVFFAISPLAPKLRQVLCAYSSYSCDSAFRADYDDYCDVFLWFCLETTQLMHVIVMTHNLIVVLNIIELRESPQ